MHRPTNLPPGFEDLRGRTFKDRYEITELVDAGTRRVLFAGREREGQRSILLRVLRPLALHEEVTVARFGKRMAAAGRVRHPTIHGALDSGEVIDGTLWVSYERPAGFPLLEAVTKTGGRLPWPDGRSVLLQLVQGLRAAHVSRVVHGALHPSSCWIDRPTDGTACSLRLIDLGTNADPSLEDASLESSRTINLGGDAEFVAPETAGVSMGDQRTDVYLVGLMAYVLLTGRPPFEGGNAFKVIAMHMQSAVPPMRELGADVPPAVEDLVRALLAKETGQRPEMARVEQLILVLDEDGQPQEVSADESAQSGGRKGRGRAKRSQSTDGLARENSRGEAIARAAEPTHASSGSSLHRMLPGQDIMTPATPGAPRPGHGASAGAATPTDRIATPAAVPIAMPTPASSDSFPADGGTLLLQGNAPARLDSPLPADGGTLLLQGNAPALLDSALPADGGTLLQGNAAELPVDGGTLLQGNAPTLLEPKRSNPPLADGGTLLLQSNASAPLDSTMRLAAGPSSGKESAVSDATLTLPGGGASEPLAGTLLLPSLDEPRGSDSEPAGSTVALTMQLPGAGTAEASQGGTEVVTRSSPPARTNARSTAVAPRSAGTDTGRAAASTAGTKVATKPSATSTMQRTSQTTIQKAGPGGGSQVWLIALTVLAVVAGVAVGLLM